MSESEKKPGSSAPPSSGPGREDRLRRQATALRDNLKKRKAQARGRQNPPDNDQGQGSLAPGDRHG
jgi:hypothetical protein